MSALESNLLALLFKASVIFVGVLAVRFALRRASAATRHLGTALAMFGLALLPFLTLSLPVWKLPLLPRSTSQSTAAGAMAPVDPEPGRQAELATIAAPGPPSSGAGDERHAGPTAGLPRPGLATWLLAGWAAGSALVLARLLTGVFRVRWILRNGVRVTAADVLRLLDDCGHTLGLRVRPLVISSAEVGVPLVWGWLRPVLILPSGSTGWSPDRMRAVMLHELAHLKRHDWPVLLLGRLVASLYWFHPLAWFVERSARRDCERACDDVVVAFGTKPSDYASHLLSIARGASDTPASVRAALAVVRRSQLNSRLRSILDPMLRRNAPSRTAVTALGAAMMLVLVPFASVQLAERAYADEPETNETLLAQHVWHERVHTSDDDSEVSAGKQAYQRGYELHSAGRYLEAAEAFEQAADEGFRPGASMYNVACCHALRGEAGRAMNWLDKAMEAGFDDPTNLVEDSDFDRIRTDAGFQRFIDEAFANADIEREFPRHYPYRATMERFRELKDASSTNGKEWHQVGYRLISLGEYDLAIEAFTAAVETMGEKRGTAMYNLACAHSLAGGEGRALEWLDRSLDAGFDQHERFLNDADLENVRNSAEFDRIREKSEFLSLGRFPRRGWERSDYSVERWAPAIADYQEFVGEHPASGRGWFNLGWALHHSERFDESIRAFEKAVSLGFRTGTSNYNIACGHAMSNRKDAALDALEAAVSSGAIHAGHLEDDDDLENLRDDARFQALVDKLEAAEEAAHSEQKDKERKLDMSQLR